MKRTRIGLVVLGLILALLLDSSGTPTSLPANLPSWRPPPDAALFDLIEAGPTEPGDRSSALDLAETTAAAHPESAKAQYELGIAYFRDGNSDIWHQSIPAFQKAITLDPNFGRAYCRLGEAYHLIHVFSQVDPHPAEEIEAFEGAIRVNPDCVEAYFELGIVYLTCNDGKTCDIGRAEGLFQKAIQAGPRSPEGYRGMAGVYSERHQEDDALRMARTVLLLDTARPASYRAIYSACDHLPNDERPAQILNEVAAAEPNNPLPYRYLGLIYLHLSRYDEAAEAYRHLIRLVPGYSEAHYELGSVHLLAGDIEGARREHRTLLRLARNSTDGSFERSRYLGRAGELKEEINTGRVYASHYGDCGF